MWYRNIEPFPPKICAGCGKEFFGHKNRKFCDDCRRAKQRERSRRRYRAHLEEFRRRDRERYFQKILKELEVNT